MTEDYETFMPSREDRTDLVRALLAAADDPSQVRTQRGGMEFSVPSHVAERYRQSLRTPARRRGKKEES